MKLSWRFIAAGLAAAGVVAQAPHDTQAWATAAGIILAALSTGARTPPVGR